MQGLCSEPTAQLSEKGSDESDEAYMQRALESFKKRANPTNPSFNEHEDAQVAHERKRL